MTKQIKNNIIKEMIFVTEQIENNHFSILPNTIANGKVYKIPAFGNLNTDGYEVGYLYLPTGSGIKEHQHINDIERYKLLNGELKINNSVMDTNICLLNNSHCINKVSKPTIIQTCKISKSYLHTLKMSENLSPKIFDIIINQETISPKTRIKK